MDILNLNLLSFSIGFVMSEIMVRKYSPKLNIKIFKKKIRIHHSYLVLPGYILIFLDHLFIASGFLGSALHDIYWHIRYRKKKLKEKINLAKDKISEKLSPAKH